MTKTHKMTDIGIIPNDWTVMTIEEVGHSFSYGVGAEAIPYDGRNKYIRITDIDDESAQYRPSPIVSPLFFGEQHILKESDIVVARTGASVGKSYIYNKIDGKLIFAGFLMKFNVNGCNPPYLAYHLRTKQYKQWVNTESARTGQPGLNIEQLKQFAFPLPSNPNEQSVIATILTNVDSLINSIEKAINKKKLMKDGAMQQLLTGKVRLTGFKEPWVEKSMMEIGQTYNGITGKGKADFGHGNSRFITFLNILNNPSININELESVDIDPINDGQNEVRKGDLFFNTSSETPEDVGTCSTLLHDVENVYLNSFCFGFRLKDSEISGLFMSYYFRSEIGRHEMATLAQGATRYNLSKENFYKIIVRVPKTKEEQNAITKVLATMDSEISALEAERDKYISIKQGMMQKLLTGQIRLPQSCLKEE